MRDEDDSLVVARAEQGKVATTTKTTTTTTTTTTTASSTENQQDNEEVEQEQIRNWSDERTGSHIHDHSYSNNTNGLFPERDTDTHSIPFPPNINTGGERITPPSSLFSLSAPSIISTMASPSSSPPSTSRRPMTAADILIRQMQLDQHKKACTSPEQQRTTRPSSAGAEPSQTTQPSYSVRERARWLRREGGLLWPDSMHSKNKASSWSSSNHLGTNNRGSKRPLMMRENTRESSITRLVDNATAHSKTPQTIEIAAEKQTEQESQRQTRRIVQSDDASQLPTGNDENVAQKQTNASNTSTTATSGTSRSDEIPITTLEIRPPSSCRESDVIASENKRSATVMMYNRSVNDGLQVEFPLTSSNNKADELQVNDGTSGTLAIRTVSASESVTNSCDVKHRNSDVQHHNYGSLQKDVAADTTESERSIKNDNSSNTSRGKTEMEHDEEAQLHDCHAKAVTGEHDTSPPSLEGTAAEKTANATETAVGDIAILAGAEDDDQSSQHEVNSSDRSVFFKYEHYACLVDAGQGDRSIQIILFSLARPHMRAFHFAWMSFFVAFFTWFAITPLLSEVQLSLDLTKAEIWTSTIFAVSGACVTRILIGPVCDVYGARYAMGGTLGFCVVPAMALGLIQTRFGLNVTRLLVGVAGSAFVTCQYWTTCMFTREVAGTAQALVAGWGNLGGGVTQVVIGSIVFPILKCTHEQFGKQERDEVSNSAENFAWRAAMFFPAVLAFIMAIIVVKYSDDSPRGNYDKLRRQGFLPSVSAGKAMRDGASNRNTWILFCQYGCCFGVEITMVNAAALYFKEEFGQSTETAAAIASTFGWMNLFARGVGGFISDISNAKRGMRGRLWWQTISLILEGLSVIVFSQTKSLGGAIVAMMIFSMFVQAAEGSTFGIVPYVNPSTPGSIAGFVGAGGSVGGVLFAVIFREFDYRRAFLLMGFSIMASSLLTILLHISGHAGLFCGEDAPEVRHSRHRHGEILSSSFDTVSELWRSRHSLTGEGHDQSQHTLTGGLNLSRHISTVPAEEKE